MKILDLQGTESYVRMNNVAVEGGKPGLPNMGGGLIEIGLA
jgi:hypothetical protein